MRITLLALLISAAIVIVPAQAQRGSGPRPASPPAAAKPAPEEGIPVTDATVIAKCAPCHGKGDKGDDKGNLTRIAWSRTTPEGWQEVIKRMVRLNHLELKPEEARTIVKSLSTTHGLAPDEAKPVMFIPEQRMIDEPMPNDMMKDTCASCHPLGRAASWRRSKEEWDLLIAMHMGYFPVTDISFRRFRGPNETPAPGADSRQPYEQAAAYLTTTYPLSTPEWASWRARMRAPKLSGRWLISGYHPARGKVIGEMVVEPSGGAEDEFTTNVKLTYIKDGSTLTRSGKSFVYTGYSWRGRTTLASGAVPPAPGNAGGNPKELREVMWVSPDQSTMEGRWFWGEYQEFGYDVTLHRAGEGATVTSVDRTMLKTGSTAQRVKIYGDNFTRVTAADIDMGHGVTVKNVVEQSPQQITVEVDLDDKALLGRRDVAVRRAVAANTIVLSN